MQRSIRFSTEKWWQRLRVWSRVWQHWVLLAVLVAATWLRFYKVDQTMMFLGDQGRDALVVARMFTQGNMVFIGPVTSVGNMYLGPLYYYFMLPFLWLSYPSPIGPVYAVGALGVLTVFLAYYWGKKMVGTLPALIAAWLVAFSPALIEASRFSWNPNPSPLVGLAWVYGLVQALHGRRWYWCWAIICCGILLQLHYVTLLLAMITGMAVLIELWKLRQQRQWRRLVVPVAVGIGLVILLNLPLMLFDVKHDWLNTRSFYKIIIGDDAFAAKKPLPERLSQSMYSFRDRLTFMVTQVPLTMPYQTAAPLTVLILATLIFLLLHEKDRYIKHSGVLLLSVLVACGLGLAGYKNSVYIHYILFMLPISFLLLGYAIAKLWHLNWLEKALVVLLLGYYAWQGVQGINFVGSGPKLSMLAATANAIHLRVRAGDPYSILLISSSKDTYGMNYRYFLTTDRTKQPLEPEQFAEATKLFVLWEDKSVPAPLTVPLYELLVFNTATPSASIDILDGPTILELEKTR